MTPDEILDAFSARTFPSEAIAACRADRDAASQTLLNLLEDFLDQAFEGDPDESERAEDALFMVVHLLAEFREKRAFPLLMRLLGCAADMVERVLGDAISETLPGILISTFDGNLNGLHQIITNRFSNEFARASALHALAYLTVEGVVPKELTQQFLRECFDQFQNEKTNFVWIGWVSSISTLGLESFVPLVEQAFRDNAIDPYTMQLSEFQDGLRRTLNPQEQHLRFRVQSPFDNVDVMSSWAAYNPERDRTPSPTAVDPGSKVVDRQLPRPNIEPHLNPHRNVGRNDPCPCGSGKKFKKCCLE